MLHMASSACRGDPRAWACACTAMGRREMAGADLRCRRNGGSVALSRSATAKSRICHLACSVAALRYPEIVGLGGGLGPSLCMRCRQGHGKWRGLVPAADGSAHHTYYNVLPLPKVVLTQLRGLLLRRMTSSACRGDPRASATRGSAVQVTGNGGGCI